MPDPVTRGDARTLVRLQHVAALRAQPELTGVQVEFGWPGEKRERECLCLGPVTGLLETAHQGTGTPSPDNPITYDDHFRYVVFLAATEASQTSDEAEARGRHLWNAVLRVARIHPFDGIPGLMELVLAEANDETIQTEEGFVFYADTTVNAYARYEGTPT